MLIDLHTHSYPKSDDSFMGVDDLIDAAKALKLDGVCLTEHDSFWSQDEVSDLSQKHGFLVLAGAEINTDSGHVVVFGLEEYVFGLHKPALLRRLVDQRGGVLIAAHPYRRRFWEESAVQAQAEMLGRAVDDEFFQVCDAIEGINGRGKASENRFSRELGVRLGARMTGGSDAHRLEQLGTAATRFQRKITGMSDLIEELRAGRFESVDLKSWEGAELPASS